MFKVGSVAPTIRDYHFYTIDSLLAALLVNAIAAVPSQTTTGPTGLIVGVAGIGFTVTTLVPVNNTEQLVTGLVARTVIVVFALSALVTRLIAPPVPAITLLNEVAPLNNS
jgi:hypothetical protein